MELEIPTFCLVSKEIVCKITDITEFPQPEPVLQDFFPQDDSDFLRKLQTTTKNANKSWQICCDFQACKNFYSRGFEGFGYMIHRKIKSA